MAEGDRKGRAPAAGKSPPKPPSGICQAALFYARRGWPVFPCREADETLPSKGDGKPPRILKAKQPYTPHGLNDATTDEHQIKLWWTRWPKAMIGLPMGVNGCFALDFDPRTDAETGEVFTLERLKGELEAAIGGALPTSLAVVTPSDGVHVYLAQPGDVAKGAEPIRNRGNLPRHVDVRGQGGYVIAPPSLIHPGTPQERQYRFLRGKWDAEVGQAPAALVELLRGKARKAAPAAAGNAAADQAATAFPSPSDDPVEEAVRRYALAGCWRRRRWGSATSRRTRPASSSGSWSAPARSPSRSRDRRCRRPWRASTTPTRG
jgi:putative DNA primase/helicase